MYTRINVWGAVLLCRLAPACDWPIAQIYSYIFPKGGGKFLPWCSEDVSHTHSLEGGEKKKKEKKALQDTPCTGSHHSAMLLPWDTSILMLHNSVAWGRTFSLYGTHWICPQPLMAQCLSVNLVFWLSSYSAGMTKKKKETEACNDPGYWGSCPYSSLLHWEKSSLSWQEGCALLVKVKPKNKRWGGERKGESGQEDANVREEGSETEINTQRDEVRYLQLTVAGRSGKQGRSPPLPGWLCKSWGEIEKAAAAPAHSSPNSAGTPRFVSVMS